MLSNILANWIKLVVTGASVFALYPFLVGTVGKEYYSLWLLIVAITGNFTLLRLGVPSAMVRHLSKYESLGQQERVDRVMGSALLLFLGMGVAVIALGLVLAGMLDTLFYVPQDKLWEAQVAFVITVVACAISFPLDTLEGALHAYERFVAFNVVETCVVIARVSAKFLLVTPENGLMTIAWVMAGEVLARGAFFYFVVKRKLPRLRFNIFYFERGVLKELMGYSVYVLVLHFSVRLAFQTDPLVVSAFVSPASIVLFSVGSSFVQHLSTIANGVTAVMFPRVSILHTQSRHEELRRLYLSTGRLVFLLFLPVCTAFVTVGGDSIALWMGEDFRVPSGAVLQVLAGSYLFYLVQDVGGRPILMGSSKMRVPTLSIAAAALVNVGLSITLGSSLGIIGVAWGTAIPNTIYAFSMMAYTSRTMDVPFFFYLRRVLLVPALAAVFFLSPVLGIRHLLGFGSFALFFSAIVVGLICYAVACYFLFLEPEQKLWVRHKLDRVLPRRVRKGTVLGQTSTEASA
jgi:O-antigen/teichoic acid export membrane protein